jgi:hypothetical protein
LKLPRHAWKNITLGVTEKDLLDAAAKVRERMLTEVYGLEDKALYE